jgi:hypothetical protein
MITTRKVLFCRNKSMPILGTCRVVRNLNAEIIEEPHVNPGPKHREMWLRDPDGYVVVLASPDGEAG